MTPSPTVSLCVLCHMRPTELRDALASAAHFDEIIVVDMASEPALDPVPGVTWIRCEENRGVAAGRNLQARAASGDVLVFLDDDAVFRSHSAADDVRSLFGDAETKAVAFRVVRADGSTRSEEFPFRGDAHDVETPRPCAYFVGGAAAVRRTSFLDVGGFDERFRYSTEELDLSMALVSDGTLLRYEPSIVVEHRPSDQGRHIAPEVAGMRLRNRLLLVRRHLPLYVAVPHVLLWAGRTFLEAARTRSLGPWMRGWRGLKEPVDRRPIAARVLLRVHRHGGRVLW
jgi:GT2 family glycosyltransferase